MSHVFLSYAHQDLEFVNRLADDLEASGLAVWYFHRYVKPGDPVDTLVDEGLRTAIALIAVVSPDAMSSASVHNEVSFALDNDQRIIAVLHRFAPLFPALERADWLDFSSPDLYVSSIHKLTALLTEEFSLSTRPAVKGQTIPESAVFSGVGVEVAEGKLTVADDPRHISDSLRRRYLRLLAVIAAPFCNTSGEGPPRLPLNLTLEWRRFASAITSATQLAQRQQGAPLFVRRLSPPSPAHLADTLNDTSPDAYQIVHFIGHSDESGTLYLEDEWGHETPLSPEVLIDSLQKSTAQLLVAQSPLSPVMIEELLAETPLEAVISLKAPVAPVAADLFTRRFYTQLLAGQSIHQAFDQATTSLHECCADDARQYSLLLKPGLQDVQLDLPSPQNRAALSLIDLGLPPLSKVPVHWHFVGQRAALNELSGEIASSAFRQIAIYGEAASGKSWLAAEYVARFAWRYPDGILWMRISRHTKSEDVIGQLLALLALPLSTNWATLRDVLRERSVLIVLDQADEWGDPLEIGELADFIARLDQVGGTRILITAAGPVQPLTFTAGTEENQIQPLALDEAELLIRQVIYEHDMENELADRTMLDGLLKETLGVPWLIREGIQMVRLDGLEVAMRDLLELTNDVAIVFEHYISIQLQHLSPPALQLLRRLQGVDAGFERRLAGALGNESTDACLRELAAYNLVRREGPLYSIPTAVRYLLQTRMPLSEAEQNDVDAIVTHYLLSQSTRNNN